MPRLFESYSERYGLFGVTLALIGWLLCISFIVVAATAIASEFDRVEDPWARGVRRAMRIEPASIPAAPAETLHPAEPGSL
jgi:membrane protein